MRSWSALARARLHRRAKMRRSSATWSFRLRPVWRRLPRSPSSLVSRDSTLKWTSSYSGSSLNLPSRISTWIRRSAPLNCSASSVLRILAFASAWTWARLPSTSSSASCASSGVESRNAAAAGSSFLARRCERRLTGGCSLLAGFLPYLERQAPDLDEALRGGVVVRVLGAVGREALVVERIGARPSGDGHGALEELELDLAGDAFLGVLEEDLEVLHE